jgi:hypothetical protein
MIATLTLCLASCSASSDVGGAPSANTTTDPCDQRLVFDGKETVSQFEAACPQWKSANAPRSYPVTVKPSVASHPGNAILGATDTDWSRVHVMDPNGTAGYAYDPSPGSYPDGDDHFIGVTHNNGRVDGLTERLPANTPIREAVKAASAMLPNDAINDQVMPLDVCGAMNVTSTTLQRELGSADAVVFFGSGTADDHYDPTDVGDLTIVTNQTVTSTSSC